MVPYTHCGKPNRRIREEVACEHCGRRFMPANASQRYCCRECGVRWSRQGRPQPGLRRVARPPFGQLMREITALGHSAVGRRYGVSDNAIRKWVRQYEREAER